MRFNWRDFLERVGWTAFQASVGALLDLALTGEITLRSALYAALIAAAKVIVAQQVGRRATGDAIPGGVEPR
jgi:hypothetical protein